VLPAALLSSQIQTWWDQGFTREASKGQGVGGGLQPKTARATEEKTIDYPFLSYHFQ